MYNSIDSVVGSYSSFPKVSYNDVACCSSYKSPIFSADDVSYSPADFAGVSYTNSAYSSSKISSAKNYVSHSDFVNPYAGRTVFVGDAESIKDFAEEAFLATTGKELPSGIIISVCSEDKMKDFHPGWHPGIEGFSINTHPKMVFVKRGELARVMATLGHELGHVVSSPLRSDVDEEAKAFSFELAWIRAIKENNIGNLAKNLVIPEPAHNNLHDVALDFVLKEVGNDVNPLDLFWKLSLGDSSVDV